MVIEKKYNTLLKNKIKEKTALHFKRITQPQKGKEVLPSLGGAHLVGPSTWSRKGCRFGSWSLRLGQCGRQTSGGFCLACDVSLSPSPTSSLSLKAMKICLRVRIAKAKEGNPDPGHNAHGPRGHRPR